MRDSGQRSSSQTGSGAMAGCAAWRVLCFATTYRAEIRPSLILSAVALGLLLSSRLAARGAAIATAAAHSPSVVRDAASVAQSPEAATVHPVSHSILHAEQR